MTRLASWFLGTALVSAALTGAPDATGTPANTSRATGEVAVWRPAPGTTWQWQIVGSPTEPFHPVAMYDVDLQDAVPSRRTVRVPGFGASVWPRGVSAGVIDDLHAGGITAICYLDTGAWESYRPDAGLFPPRVIGRSTGWRGERWLDLRRSSWSRFAPIIRARLRLAAAIGCDGVEPDQNNPLGNHPGFAITRADEKGWYLHVAAAAHRLGLSVGMKNGVEVVDADTVAAFDWALNEECFYYAECGVMRRFVRAGKAVFQTEYVVDWRRRGAGSARAVLDLVCARSRALGFSTLVKRRVPDASFRHC